MQDKQEEQAGTRQTYDRVTMTLRIPQDNDIKKHLDGREAGSVSDYLRDLVRQDMARQGGQHGKAEV